MMKDTLEELVVELVSNYFLFTNKCDDLVI